jgi:hypothetical protein
MGLYCLKRLVDNPAFGSLSASAGRLAISLFVKKCDLLGLGTSRKMAFAGAADLRHCWETDICEPALTEIILFVFGSALFLGLGLRVIKSTDLELLFVFGLILVQRMVGILS